ncbi:MAG: Grx4 family monothiol glutaredoxin [Myxococcota bacterium]
MLSDKVRDQIQSKIDGHEVVLFMKGHRRMPQCGFSAQVVQILDSMLPEYETVNVLADPEVRQGIKAFSDWPTIPQLYVKGEFVGGCDIVVQKYQDGELAGLLGQEPVKVEPPTLQVTTAAAEALKGPLSEQPGLSVRLMIDPSFRPNMDLDTKGPLDLSVEAEGVTFIMDGGTAQRANGLSIDFVPGPQGGFKLDNPNAPTKVKQIAPEDVQKKVAAGDKLELVDVRTPQEASIGRIEAARLLDEDYEKELLALDKDTMLVFHCHHGGRSQAAAEAFAQRGFKNVHNMTGGIDAWALHVDNTVPRY